jgi:hypothetical protein
LTNKHEGRPTTSENAYVQLVAHNYITVDIFRSSQ